MTPSYAPLAVVILTLLSLPAQAAQVLVERATGTSVSTEDIEAATELVRAAVAEVSADSVTEDVEKADYKLRPKLIRLGNSFILSLSKIRAGKNEFSGQLKAAHLDELDKVATRLTRSVILGEKAPDNPRVGEITDHEEKEGTQRRPARKAAYLSFGGSAFSSLNSSGLGYSLGLGYSWDINRARLKLMSQADVNGAAYALGASLGANYYFTTTDLAPYLAADFGAGAAKLDGGGAFDGQTVAGFMVGGGGGIELLRTSSVNVDIGFRAGFLLHANAIGTPQILSLRLGLYF